MNKLRLQGVSCIEIAPGPPPYKIAAYVRGTKVTNNFSLAIFRVMFVLVSATTCPFVEKLQNFSSNFKTC